MSKVDTDKKKAERVLISWLERLHIKYKKTKNPVFAMLAFIVANTREDLDIATPSWVLHWVCNAFTKYYNASGKENLESLLGFQYGKGKDPSKDFKHIIIAERDASLLWHMCVIKSKVPEFNIEDTAKIVLKRMKETAPKKVENVSSSTLKRKYINEGWTNRESSILGDTASPGRESFVASILAVHGIEPNDNTKNEDPKSSTTSDLVELIFRKPWGNTK